jgi:hypothetical protein
MNGAPRDTPASPNPAPRATLPGEVIASWRAAGRIERVATGFPTLDEACRGGLGFGRRHYLVGAPGAGKTALANVIARRLLGLGLVVGILASDEEPSDLVVRYRSQDAAENATDMAAAKGSGSVEYSAQLLLALRSVKGQPDLVHVVIVKNRGAQAGGELYLSLDRRRHELTETDAPEKPEAADAADRGLQHVRDDAAKVAGMLASRPGIGVVKLRSAMRGTYGSFANGRTDTALAALEGAVVERGGPRGAKQLYLEGPAIPEAIVACIPLDDRPRIVTSRPPPEGGDS